MRVQQHPILDISKERKKVHIYVDGREIEAYEDESVASALLAAGIKAFRKTPRFHKPRGIFCGIGRCTDCALTINGIPNIRSCITKVEEGMQVELQDGLGKWN